MSTGFPAERWPEVDRLFEAALELPEPERAAYVERACAGDSELAAAVRALLDAERGSRRFLERPGGAGVAAMLRELEAEAPDGEVAAAPRPARIGRYRVVDELGRGGWGTVYRAERDAGDFEQSVAIKVLRRGLDTEDVLARFRAEGQILGSLGHRNIARLLDGGATDDGRPYLVMELVEGAPITDYCESRGLPVAERLGLFMAVGRAVQHAHRNLVVHRDLKPGNILVTADGEVKLLDFGIAKLLDPARNEDAPQTRTGVRPMTPDYASPEQLSGEPITTASDVYQLGLLLYELLTGCRPYQPVGESERSVEERITGGDPPAPSARVLRGAGSSTAQDPHARRVARQLRGDLDTIALKALRHEPERRYASAAELVEDVERHLAGQPVRARPDRWSYRAWKLARRRPGAVAAGAAALLVAGLYTGTLRAHAGQLQQERDRARVEAEKARQVADFMGEVFTLTGPNVTKGEEVTARELLDEAARRLRSRLAEQPPVRAALLSAVARVYHDYGLTEPALELYTEAVAAREPVAVEHAADQADDLRAIAFLLERTQPERSDTLYVEALALAERHAGASHPVVARILTDYGHSLSWRGAAPDDSVRQMYRRGVEVLRDATDDVREDLAHLLTISAYGQPAEARWFDGSTALDRMREALDLRVDLLGEESIAVASSLSDLALAVEAVDSGESVRLLRRAVGIMDRLVQKRHPLALTLIGNLAAVHQDRGERELAEPLLREVVALYDVVSPSSHGKAYPLSHLGSLLNGLGRGAEAEPLLVESIELFDAMQLAPDDQRVLVTRARLATALALQGRFTEAEHELLAADRRVRAAGGAAGSQVVIEAFARLYDAWGRTEDADRARAELAAFQASR